jgi:hypothetical protein
VLLDDVKGIQWTESPGAKRERLEKFVARIFGSDAQPNIGWWESNEYQAYFPYASSSCKLTL